MYRFANIVPLALTVPEAVILLANINPLELTLSPTVVVAKPKVPRIALIAGVLICDADI